VREIFISLFVTLSRLDGLVKYFFKKQERTFFIQLPEGSVLFFIWVTIIFEDKKQYWSQSADELTIHSVIRSWIL
jgi:hypothetical protein